MARAAMRSAIRDVPCSSAPTAAAVPAADAARTAAAPRVALSDAPVRIPRDEAPHHEADEWWYFNGHLWGVSASGRLYCFGFEYVTFQFLGTDDQAEYFGNFSITNLTSRTFQYGVRESTYAVPREADSFSLHTGSWRMQGGDGDDALTASLPGYALDLKLHTLEPAVLHGNRGNIPYGPFGTSKYYSWTDLAAAGTIRDHGVLVHVLGLSWMDHQWGDFDLASGGGWDWFSVQLFNGQQYMLYFIRNSSGAIVQTIATRVRASGWYRPLPARSVSERTTGTWTSPATKITYSSGWKLHIPGGTLTVRPDLRNQEVDAQSSQGVAYWEGDVGVSGRIDGRTVRGIGYTEINPPGVP